jgi:hypothetical protein
MYRARIRLAGPVLALLIPCAMGATAWWLLRGNESTMRGVSSFLLAVLAAPMLLVAGVPLTSSPPARVAAVVASMLLWLLIGVLASRRATSSPVASWRDFWREYAWLACGVWLGVVGALVAVNLLMGRALV